MRSVRPDGVGNDWNVTAWMAAGFGLAAAGGFFIGFLKDQEALTAARRFALALPTPPHGSAAAVRQLVDVPRDLEPLPCPAETGA